MTQTSVRRSLISVVVPALNEESNLPELYARVRAVFEEALPDYDWELVITDNRSSDRTFDVAAEIAAEDPRVRAFRFSKNFGYQRSIFAGYLLATGHAVVQLDADMQDPPELLPQLIERWESGASVVYGVRTKRAGENFVLTGTRRVFYRAIDWLSDEELPADAGDFRLVDRRIVELLRHNHDASPYLRGSIAAMGFEQVGVEYERDSRKSGETKFRFGTLVRLAVDGILNHSTRPLQLASFTAALIVAVCVIGIVAYLVARIGFGQDWPAGFVSLALLQLIGILLNAAFLGIIGAYLGRLFIQSRNEPSVVIEKMTGDPRDPMVFSSAPPVSLRSLTKYQSKDARDD